MKIIQRYILREFIVPLFYCLTGFASIYILFELFGSFSRMLDSDMGLADAALYLAGYLAPYFHYLAPAALMLATLYTMWTMCRHSEIVAMRASGISFRAIVRPLLSVAVLMAVFVTFVNEWFVPNYAQWAAQMKTERFDASKITRADNICYRNASGFRTWNIDGLYSYDGSSLSNVCLRIDRPHGERLMTVSAKRADYLDGEWWFSGLTVQHFDESGREIASPTPEVDALDFRSFGFLNESPADFLLQNRPMKFYSVIDRIRYLKTHPNLSFASRNETNYDIWAQIMAPLACLVITLFAIPAGISSGRQSVSKGILGALGMYFSFYGVTILCMVLAKNGWCPPIPAAVFPDVLFLALGIRIFLKQR